MKHEKLSNDLHESNRCTAPASRLDSRRIHCMSDKKNTAFYDCYARMYALRLFAPFVLERVSFDLHTESHSLRLSRISWRAFMCALLSTNWVSDAFGSPNNYSTIHKLKELASAISYSDLTFCLHFPFERNAFQSENEKFDIDDRGDYGMLDRHKHLGYIFMLPLLLSLQNPRVRSKSCKFLCSQKWTQSSTISTNLTAIGWCDEPW